MEDDSLLNAASTNDLAQFKEFLATGKLDVNYRGSYISPGGKVIPGEETALGLAAAINQHEMVKLLLAQPGIDVNKGNYDGFTPLMHASLSNTREVFRLLIADKRVDVNQSDRVGRTSLFLLISGGRARQLSDLIVSRREFSLDLPVPYSMDMAKKNIVKETWKKWDLYGDLTMEILERYEKDPEETMAWLEGAGDSLFA